MGNQLKIKKKQMTMMTGNWIHADINGECSSVSMNAAMLKQSEAWMTKQGTAWGHGQCKDQDKLTCHHHAKHGGMTICSVGGNLTGGFFEDNITDLWGGNKYLHSINGLYCIMISNDAFESANDSLVAMAKGSKRGLQLTQGSCKEAGWNSRIYRKCFAGIKGGEKYYYCSSVWIR